MVGAMHEFATVSASSTKPAALADKLTEKSAEGWSVVSIVPTGGDVTAFLSRAAGAASAPVTPVAEPAAEQAPAPVAEPAGWAVAPEPSTQSMAPIADPTPAPNAYQPAPAASAVPAGWYADPAGRFELRYWDGGTWTEHVSRAGQQYTDPPVA